MKQLFTVFGLLMHLLLSAQVVVATFEDIEVPPDSALNGRYADGQFRSANAIFPNEYIAEFDAWSGWAISRSTDFMTPGFQNQYSSITGGGWDGSLRYGVTYGEKRTVRFESRVALEGFYISNNTYAYYSMRDGDAFAKRFGGESGNDPDFFKVTIFKYLDGQVSTDSVEFFLADYRSSVKFIRRPWTWVDLRSLGEADSLLMVLSSSDVGEFGINTPLYFCLDDLTTRPLSTSTRKPSLQAEVRVYPNPVQDQLQFTWNGATTGTAQLFDINGKLLLQQTLNGNAATMNVQHLPNGVYILRGTMEQAYFTQRIVKQ